MYQRQEIYAYQWVVLMLLIGAAFGWMLGCVLNPPPLEEAALMEAQDHEPQV